MQHNTKITFFLYYVSYYSCATQNLYYSSATKFESWNSQFTIGALVLYESCNLLYPNSSLSWTVNEYYIFEKYTLWSTSRCVTGCVQPAATPQRRGKKLSGLERFPVNRCSSVIWQYFHEIWKMQKSVKMWCLRIELCEMFLDFFDVFRNFSEKVGFSFVNLIWLHEGMDVAW